MVYLVKTTDGGLTWTKEALVSRVVEPSEQKHDMALMPSTVRASPTKLVTCIRNLTAYPKVGWIECRVSTDNGKTWSLQSTPVGDEAGTTPPALSRLADGRLVLTYGYRKPLQGPTSIRAKLSDDGRTWSEELILRSGGGDEDIGYTRNAVRPDGRVVTIYYWQEDEKAERDIEDTWASRADREVKSRAFNAAGDSDYSNEAAANKLLGMIFQRRKKDSTVKGRSDSVMAENREQEVLKLESTLTTQEQI